MKLQSIKEAIRSGGYAWPGGYPLFFVTGDSCAVFTLESER